MIDTEWLEKNPLEDEACKKVDWGLTEAPDISSFLEMVRVKVGGCEGGTSGKEKTRAKATMKVGVRA